MRQLGIGRVYIGSAASYVLTPILGTSIFREHIGTRQWGALALITAGVIVYNVLATTVPMKIPFNKPYMTGKELSFIEEAHDQGHLAGDGMFTRRCHEWLEQQPDARRPADAFLYRSTGNVRAAAGP